MSLVSDALAAANGILGDFQLKVTITWEPLASEDLKGKRTYGTAVPLTAVVDLTRKQRVRADGVMVTIVATVIVLDVVSSADGTIGMKDRITLPGGLTAPILSGPGAVLDGSTNSPFLNELMLGHVSENS